MTHPQQPTYTDENGVKRFVPNGIIVWLFESGKLSLNEIATMPFSREDCQQLAQQLGYSVSGYEDLSYVEDEERCPSCNSAYHALPAWAECANGWHLND